jgi:hypothetical protein
MGAVIGVLGGGMIFDMFGAYDLAGGPVYHLAS